MDAGKALFTAITLIFTCKAQAELSASNGGLGVYDSHLNVIWTQDANLLNTLENSNGYSATINAIITAVPTIYDTPNVYDNGGNGVYNLSVGDFIAGGKVDWWAAQAFVSYLNLENYAGIHSWVLPSADTACAGNYCTNSQMGEVYYNEEGGLAGRGYFSNVQAYGYWSSNQNASDSGSAWDFFTQHGLQYYDAKSFDFYALAVSGQVTTAPVPGAVWLFGTGLLGLPGLMKRRNRR